MSGLFKKTSWKIEGKVFDFFDILFQQLPNEFQFLTESLHAGVYKKFSVKHSTKEQYYTIGFNPSLSDKSMIKGKNFELMNILVIQNGSQHTLNITVYAGLWVGFEIEQNILDLTNFHFDLSKLRKDTSKFAKDNRIEKLVRGLSSARLDLNDLSEFEIDGKRYYQIKDLEDGNYIAIDGEGHVFGLIHDPYRIERLNKSIKQFVEDVNNGRFDFAKYLIYGDGYTQH